MLNLYINADPHLRHHIARAHRIRAATFSVLFRRLWRALVPAGLRQRLACRRLRKRNLRELRALSDLQLKDIGVARGEILFRSTAALPAGCRG